jgi:transcriptional regulator with XRE-family HTH domain
MTGFDTEAQFNDAFCARVRALRVERRWTQDQMATALGIPLDRYRKYEVRSPLPVYLLERFALLVDRNVEYLVTGRASPRKLLARHRTGTEG